MAAMRRLYLTLIIAAGIAVFAYDHLIKPDPIPVRLINMEELSAERPSVRPLLDPPESSLLELEMDASIPPDETVVTATDISIVNDETLRVISRMLDQVQQDLRTGRYGEPNQLPYNIVYLFRQSLAAYLGYLQNPTEGPDFHILFHRPFSGRYQFHSNKILMGSPTLSNGEGRFLTTMFHEYQHHLYHTIYGTPQFPDIVWKFYNELTAHTLEDLFADYLPPRYFERAHRGGLPRIIKRHLENGDGYRTISVIYDLMVPPGAKRVPFYRFMVPVKAGYIDKRELVHSIDETFHPNSTLVDEFAIISERYWQNQAQQ